MTKTKRSLKPEIRPAFRQGEIERTMRAVYVESILCTMNVERYQRELLFPSFLEALDDLYLGVIRACEFSSFLEPEVRIEALTNSIVCLHFVSSKLMVFAKTKGINQEQLNKITIAMGKLSELLHAFRAYSDERFSSGRSKNGPEKAQKKNPLS